MDINIIRNLYKNSKVKWSAHCLKRMRERNITIADVDSCVLSGEIIEDYPDDFPYPSCLIFGYSERKQVIHAVVASDGNMLYIVTVCYPDTKKFKEDLRTRR